MVMTQEERDKVIEMLVSNWKHSTSTTATKAFWVNFYNSYTDEDLLEELLNPYNRRRLTTPDN
jgi:hypothetical protein